MSLHSEVAPLRRSCLPAVRVVLLRASLKVRLADRRPFQEQFFRRIREIDRPTSADHHLSAIRRATSATYRRDAPSPLLTRSCQPVAMLIGFFSLARWQRDAA